jgi:hypothetical protein
LPYNDAKIEEKIGLILSERKDGVRFSANVNQNCSRFFAEGSELLPTIMAAFIAPIEVPAIISNLIPYLSKVL